MLLGPGDYDQGGFESQRVNNEGCSIPCTRVSIKVTCMAVVSVCLYLGSSSFQVLGLSSFSAK
jgi:hypothetical protein